MSTLADLRADAEAEIAYGWHEALHVDIDDPQPDECRFCAEREEED